MLERNRRAKEYLRRIRRLDDAVDAALAQLETIKSDITHITPRYDGMPGSPGSAPDTSAAVARLMAAREACSAAVDAYVEHKTRCMELINRIRVRKPELAEVLTLRYVCYLSFERIAARMAYSERQVYNFHRLALRVFGRMLEKTEGEV